jgi:hypothetical protein
MSRPFPNLPANTSTVAHSVVALRKAHGHDYVPDSFGVWDVAYRDDNLFLYPHDTNPPDKPDALK